tara:strand:- start:706 stop:999 length:294 start_codon:yes stop_codon:yes gene_type:complete
MTALESYTHTDPHTKQESTKYSVSSDRFLMALKIYGVPLRSNDPPSEHVDFQHGIHAMGICRLAVHAMTDAPNRTVILARERRRAAAKEAAGENDDG